MSRGCLQDKPGHQGGGIPEHFATALPRPLGLLLTRVAPAGMSKVVGGDFRIKLLYGWTQGPPICPRRSSSCVGGQSSCHPRLPR